MFHPASLVPVEAIMTMIRTIKIDHGTNPECSLFEIHIRYMTNNRKFRVLHRYFCFLNQDYFVLVAVIWQLCILRHIFLESKMVLDQWFELVHDVVVFIVGLACILATF